MAAMVPPTVPEEIKKLRLFLLETDHCELGSPTLLQDKVNCPSLYVL